MDASTERATRIRQHYNGLAPRYDNMISTTERLLIPEGRAWVGSQASGDVLEIAVGTGRNFEHYPDSVAVTGIDLSPEMVEIARGHARRLGREVSLVVGDVERMPFRDATFDTAVSTLSLCTVPHPERALREVWRVLRPGGRFVALEHVRSPNPVVRLAQRVLNPLSLRYGCDNLLREPLDFLEPAGLEVEFVARSKLGLIEQVVARKPAR